LRHPNIAQLYEVLTTETKIYLVFEYAEWGEFFDYISKYKKMDDTAIKTKKMFWQMADAIRYCHDKNYCHR
jgi:serine/threonine protein kinase